MFENSNHRQFQKGLDTEKARANRRESQLSLRRKTREAHLQKKKRMLSQLGPAHLCSEVVGSDEKMPSIQDIPKLIAKVMNTDNLSIQLQGIRGMRLLISQNRDPPTLRIVRSGAVPKIMNFMLTQNKDEDPRKADIQNKIQFEAAWMITNICADTTQCVTIMVRLGAIKAFVNLLRNSDIPEIAEQAVWGLANILGEGKRFKDEVLSSGVIQDFVAIINDPTNVKPKVLSNAVWALSNFCRCSALELKHISSLIPVITRLLKETKDSSLIPESLWCLVYLSSKNDQIVNYLATQSTAVNIAMKYLHKEVGKYELAIQQSFTMPKLATNQPKGKNNQAARMRNTTKEAMLKMDDNIYRPCLRMLANMLACEDDVTQRVLDAGYLDIVYPFLSHFCTKQRKEVLWSISNVLAGSHQQIEAVLSRPKIFDALMNCAKTVVYSAQLEACYGICNVTVDCAAQQKKKMVEAGAIEALVGLLKNKHLTERPMLIMLEGLEAFLSVYGERNKGPQNYNPYADRVEECGGLDILEDLMSDDKLSEGVYSMLAGILQKYWVCEDNEGGLCNDDMNAGNKIQNYLKATVDTSTNQFKFGCGGAASSTTITAASNALKAANVPIRQAGNERFAF